MGRSIRLFAMHSLGLAAVAQICQQQQADANTDATGITTVATSYDEAVKATAGRRAATDWPGTPVPDTPYGAVHLNPAINPAPIRQELVERQPVPVINDPGLVGANPSLGALNAAYRADAMGVAVKDLPPGEVGMVTPDMIKDAALSRQDDIAARIEGKVEMAVAGSKNETRPVADDIGENAPQKPKSDPDKDKKPLTPAKN